MLGAVATEDLSRVCDLAVLSLGRNDKGLKPVLQEKLPRAVVIALPPPQILLRRGGDSRLFRGS